MSDLALYAALARYAKAHRARRRRKLHSADMLDMFADAARRRRKKAGRGSHARERKVASLGKCLTDRRGNKGLYFVRCTRGKATLYWKPSH